MGCPTQRCLRRWQRKQAVLTVPRRFRTEPTSIGTGILIHLSGHLIVRMEFSGMTSYDPAQVKKVEARRGVINKELLVPMDGKELWAGGEARLT